MSENMSRVKKGVGDGNGLLLKVEALGSGF